MRVAYDVEQMRPACVLVAAALRADSTVAHRFPTETWLLHPTDAMRVYEATEEQLVLLVRKTCERHNVVAPPSHTGGTA